MKKTLLSAAAILFAATSFAQVGTPVAVTGFNADGFFAPDLENEGATERGPLDGHASKFMYAYTDCNEGTVFIPESGVLVGTDGETTYQLADPTGLNTLCLSNDEYWPGHMEGTLTLATPVKAEKVGFLESAGNLGSKSFSMDVTLNYSDGTSTTVTVRPSEWSEKNAKSVFTTQARYRFTYNGDPMGIEDKTGEGGTFNIHEQVLEADATKTLVSITFKNNATESDDWGWHYLNIFAVSAFKAASATVTDGPVGVAGFNADGFFAPDLENEGATERGPLDGHASKFMYAYTDCNEGTVFIPEDGVLTGVNGTVYQLADPTGLNTLCLSNDEYWPGHMEGTLTFDKPIQSSKVGFLESAGNLGSKSFSMDVTLNYADGTATTVTVRPSEWSEKNAKSVFTTQARYRFTYNGDPMGIEDKTGEGGTFNIHEQILDIDAAKELVSMTFKNNATESDDWGWHYLNIFAVSAVADEAGIHNVATSATDNRIFDLQGRQVATPAAGQIYIQNGKKFMVK